MAKCAAVRWLGVAVVIIILLVEPGSAQAPSGGLEYRVLATSRTATMESELIEAAEAGFQFNAVMGGETTFGGSEVVVVMSRGGQATGRYAYRLLATSRTSTMQEELQQAADEGYHYRGQTVFETTFGGDEVVVILERDEDAAPQGFEYQLLATSRTETLQNELLEAGASGYEVIGMTVAKTAFGGSELVAITRRPKLQ